MYGKPYSGVQRRSKVHNVRRDKRYFSKSAGHLNKVNAIGAMPMRGGTRL